MAKQIDQSEDKASVLKSRLKRRALEAQKQVEKALELGLVEQAKQIQELNIKVFTLLDIPLKN
eukprot:CAMPEP_0170502998 /NCGR_PEP_ID=MMETSP0208-20121228/43303_1 /TAXON_ID=197538 /ORGANISM="Strombidium inclinatum, Strain S3" /LENGTH=62 /DNA_ID=CAMNT_0010782405 /DNA_START=64 /DNA_END=249 /DNA_ORIENTATION=-